MQMLCSISFLVILVFGSINSQSSPQGTCQVWGDPHLVMFPVDPAQQGLRMSYWCRSPGRMLILKNRFIEVYVNVTDAPHFNEDYEIKLFANYQVFCTITHNQPTCNSIHVQVDQINTGLDLLYQDADDLSVTINSYLVNNRNIYDIQITQSYGLTLESSGLCITKLPSCRLESSVNPFGKRRKRNLDKTIAKNICEEYMKQAYKTAKDHLDNNGSAMTGHALAACINDVSESGNPSWGQSAINFVTMDALQQSGFKGVHRRTKVKEIASAIKAAVSRAEEDSHRWIKYNLTEPIIYV